ncbi:anaphase-promoting complex, cyclosome, subunit 4-domain-containing protein [Choanephora cucurbitarum]|nr:anaphase-promoting complex, cyclosome, subunit 4-domain-containing protein [Choanephora cucurbitarum]
MPEVEFIGILATGNLSSPLQELMLDFLTPQKIKEWESTTLHGCQYSLVTTCQYILPACDRILLELSKLQGYSLWTERYGDFLEIGSVESCISCIEEFMKEVVAFTKSINRLIKSFSAFIKWILGVSEKVSDPDSIEPGTQFGVCEEPDLVFDYLDNCFVKDSIAKYFAMSAGNKHCNRLCLV